MKLARLLLLSVVAFALGVEAAAQAPLTFEQDIARPGSVYSSLTSADASACAALCSADGICMAWTFTPDGACELKASAPAPIASYGARSGLSARAPAFARRVIAAIAPEPAQTASIVEPLPARPDAAGGLLGGPEPQQSGSNLRPRLGGAARR